MTIKRTPEELAARAEYMRLYRLSKLDSERARLREYTSRMDVKERRRARDGTPEKLAKRRAHAATEAAKQRARERLQEKKQEEPDWHSARVAKQRQARTGFTPELIARTLVAQGNKCAVCQRSFEGRQIRADHCHDTGRPRGLLCHHCNIVEGMLKAMRLSPEEFAHNLSTYLAKPALEP